MSNPHHLLQETLLKEFDSAFDWADTVKGGELARWKMMYGFEPKDIRNFLTYSLERYGRGLIEEAKGKLEGMKFTGKNKGYDGNDLKSACDFYHLMAESWIEIVRYQNGMNSALDSAIKELESLKETI